MSTPGEQLSEEPSIPCPNVTDLICWGKFVFVILNDIWRRRGVAWPHGWRRAKRGITEVRRCVRPAAQNTEVPAVQTAAVGTIPSHCVHQVSGSWVE
jgi:hypothetical protein